jgi:hypothetical protein
VVSGHAGFVDTELSAWKDAPKISAEDVAEQTMQALIEDRVEVLADEATRRVKAALGQPPLPNRTKDHTAPLSSR